MDGIVRASIEYITAIAATGTRGADLGKIRADQIVSMKSQFGRMNVNYDSKPDATRAILLLSGATPFLDDERDEITRAINASITAADKSSSHGTQTQSNKTFFRTVPKLGGLRFLTSLNHRMSGLNIQST